jgi:hypothetical protein
VFSRIDDRAHQAYPGLALVVISGARPVALRRVNYYEDYQFLGLFDPHPDHPFTPWRELCVEGRELGFSLSELGLTIGGWSIKPSQLVSTGDEAAAVMSEGKTTPVAWIRAPRVGLTAKVHGGYGDLPQGPLFSLRYYEDGAALLDPFSEVRALRVLSAKPQEVVAEKKRRVPVAVLVALASVLVLAVTVAVIKNYASSGLITSDSSSRADGPVKIKKIDVSHFAGLKAGDTEAHVVSLYGVPQSDIRGSGSQSFAGSGTDMLLVRYEDNGNNGVKSVVIMIGALEFVRSRVGNEPLFDLFGRPEADAVSVLGTPSGRDSSLGRNLVYWFLPIAVTKKDRSGIEQWEHKALTLKFKPGYGCDWMKLSWR